MKFLVMSVDDQKSLTSSHTDVDSCGSEVSPGGTDEQK